MCGLLCCVNIIYSHFFINWPFDTNYVEWHTLNFSSGMKHKHFLVLPIDNKMIINQIISSLLELNSCNPNKFSANKSSGYYTVINYIYPSLIFYQLLQHGVKILGAHLQVCGGWDIRVLCQITFWGFDPLAHNQDAAHMIKDTSTNMTQTTKRQIIGISVRAAVPKIFLNSFMTLHKTSITEMSIDVLHEHFCFIQVGHEIMPSNAVNNIVSKVWNYIISILSSLMNRWMTEND